MTLTGLTTDGNYYVAVAAVDSDGNESWVSDEITFVIDNTAPTIALNGVSTITHEAGTAYVDSGASATDAVDGTVTVTTSGTVDVNTAGTYTLTYSASDATGNVATSVTRTVTVVDTTAPVITLTGLASVTHERGTTYTDAGATSDGGETVTTSGTVDVNTVGPYTLTYSASDTAGNVATSVTRTATVVDTTAPVITLTESASVTHELGTTYTDAGATSDSGETVGTSGTVDVNTVGTYTLTYSASDATGNVATSVTRTVVVEKFTEIQTLSLKKGWNLVSFYVEASDMTAATVLAPISSSLLQIKNLTEFV